MKIKSLIALCLIALSVTSSFAQKPTIISTSPIPAGTYGIAYADTLHATGPGAITWSITTGLPSWATLTDSIITGMPSATGTSILEVRATNSHGTTGPVPLSLTIVPATVPSVYTQVYAQLEADVKDFKDTVNSLWNGSIKDSILYSAQLSSANCNNGSTLASASYFANIQTELLKVKAEGVKSIAVEVSFPMLYEPFMDSSGTGLQSQFVSFYTKLADTIRAMGFKLIVECQSLDAGIDSLQANWPKLSSFYAGIGSFSTYITERSATAALVAQTMKPDYIILQEEPSTEQTNTNQPTANVSNSTQMLDSSLTAVRRLHISGMKVGAGFGPWMYDYEDFAYSFTRTAGANPSINQPLDFLDLHLFPIIEHALNCNAPGNTCPDSSANFQKNILKSISIAKSVNLPVTMSQTWLRKVMNTEWELMSDPPYSSGNVEEAREPFNFWVSLDTTFLGALYALANYDSLCFIVPFDTPEWSSYMEWSSSNSVINDCGGTATSCGTLSPSQVFSTENGGAKDSLAGAVYTLYGHLYHNKIVKPADLVAPGTPTNLTVLNSIYPTRDTVKWNASTDNIGVAGYHIWRILGTDTVSLHDIFQSPLVDKGLISGQNYCYQVQAFDMAGNVSGKAISCLLTGINNPKTTNEINVYPNPASSEIQVIGNQSTVIVIEVYNMLGEKVYQLLVTGHYSPITIDVSALPSGMYFVEVKSESGVGVRKFVKE